MRLIAAACLLAAPALAEVPMVVTDIPPVHALVAQVMGDLRAPILLLAPGADEHDFQLRPSQMQSISEAQLIVWIGPELTPWLDRAAASAKAQMLGLLAAPETITSEYGSEEEDSENAHGEEAHGYGSTDPHVWLNPDNALIWLPMIATSLASADPENAAVYEANARAAAQSVAAMDGEIKALLGPVASIPFVTYHNAYGYFAEHYALAYAGSVTDGEATEPGAGHLVGLRDEMAAENVACLFPEAQHDPVLAEQILKDLPTRLGPPLDPVGSTLAPGPKAYEALMKGLATALQSCLKP
jgi:zinc transport system substrate-binding protein